MELKSRCEYKPTSVRRFKVKGINGWINVAEFYQRQKKNSNQLVLNLNCLVNLTHENTGGILTRVDPTQRQSLHKISKTHNYYVLTEIQTSENISYSLLRPYFLWRKGIDRSLVLDPTSQSLREIENENIRQTFSLKEWIHSDSATMGDLMRSIDENIELINRNKDLLKLFYETMPEFNTYKFWGANKTKYSALKTRRFERLMYDNDTEYSYRELSTTLGNNSLNIYRELKPSNWRFIPTDSDRYKNSTRVRFNKELDLPGTNIKVTRGQDCEVVFEIMYAVFVNCEMGKLLEIPVYFVESWLYGAEINGTLGYELFDKVNVVENILNYDFTETDELYILTPGNFNEFNPIVEFDNLSDGGLTNLDPFCEVDSKTPSTHDCYHFAVGNQWQCQSIDFIGTGISVHVKDRDALSYIDPPTTPVGKTTTRIPTTTSPSANGTITNVTIFENEIFGNSTSSPLIVLTEDVANRSIHTRNERNTSSNTTQAFNAGQAFFNALVQVQQEELQDDNLTISEVATSPSISQYFNVQTAYQPVHDVFSNQTYINQAAAFGLQFIKTGRAFKFNDFWIQYVRIEAPTLELNTFANFTTKVLEACQSLIESYNRIGFKEDLEKTLCVHAMRQATINSINPIIRLLQARYTEFEQKNLQRKKREILTALFVGAAIGAVGAFFLGKNSEDYSGKIRDINNELGRQNKKIELLKDAMIGLAQATNDRFEETDKKINYLAETVNAAFDNVMYVISRLQNKMEEDLIRNRIVNQITEITQSEVNKLQILLTAQLEELRYWDSVFIELKNGHLPRGLYSVENLKKLLKDIEAQLRGEYQIALPEQDWHVFYTLPFVNHLVRYEENNGEEKPYLYLKIKIPLKRNKKQNQYQIITPSSSPFPCLKQECDFRAKTKKQLISFGLPQMVWLVNKVSGEIEDEADISHFSCHRTYEEKLCFTYSPELLKNPTQCTQAIHKWNLTGISSECEFEQRSIEEYRVIKLNNYQYMLHGSIVKTYTEDCPDVRPTPYTVSDWSRVISIRKNCDVYIPVTRQRLYGPFSDPLVGSYNLTHFSFYSPLIKELTEKFKEDIVIKPIETGSVKEITNFSAINDKLFNALKERMKDEKISQINQYSLEITRSLSKQVNELSSEFKTFTYRSTFWGYFALFGDFLQVFTTLIVIFGTLTYTRCFGLIWMGVEVIRPRPANAWSLFPKINLLPEISMHVLDDVTFISWISKIVLVTVFLILIIINLTTKWFRTVKMTIHYGSYTPSTLITQPKFSLHISIYNVTRFFRYVAVENIYIKLPVTRMPTDNVYEIKVKNSLVTWHVTDKRGRRGISLYDNLHLIAFDKNGTRLRDRNEPVFIPLERIIWTSNPEPAALKIFNNYDFAIINVIREPAAANKPVAGTSKILPSAPNIMDEDSEGYLAPTMSTALL